MKIVSACFIALHFCHDDHSAHTTASVEGLCNKKCNAESCSTTCPDWTDNKQKFNVTLCSKQCDLLNDTNLKSKCGQDCNKPMPKELLKGNGNSLYNFGLVILALIPLLI